MQSTIRRRVFRLGGFGAAAVVVLSMAFMGSASVSGASTNNYCYDQTLAGRATCAGGAQNLNAVYGWGNQHIVCIGTVETGMPYACSSGPGAGVYHGFGSFAVRTPLIRNNGYTANTVFGVAYTP